MTRPGHVLAEFPIEEAEAMVERLGRVSHLMTDPDAAERGRQRLEKAVAIERGPGGSAESAAHAALIQRAKKLLGREVVVRSGQGEKVGTLLDVRNHAVLKVGKGGLVATVPFGAVIDIQPAEAEARAA